jgi:hypothetical protein
VLSPLKPKALVVLVICVERREPLSKERFVVQQRKHISISQSLLPSPSLFHANKIFFLKKQKYLT